MPRTAQNRARNGEGNGSEALAAQQDELEQAADTAEGAAEDAASPEGSVNGSPGEGEGATSAGDGDGREAAPTDGQDTPRGDGSRGG